MAAQPIDTALVDKYFSEIVEAFKVDQPSSTLDFSGAAREIRDAMLNVQSVEECKNFSIELLLANSPALRPTHAYGYFGLAEEIVERMIGLPPPHEISKESQEFLESLGYDRLIISAGASALEKRDILGASVEMMAWSWFPPKASCVEAWIAAHAFARYCFVMTMPHKLQIYKLLRRDLPFQKIPDPQVRPLAINDFRDRLAEWSREFDGPYPEKDRPPKRTQPRDPVHEQFFPDLAPQFARSQKRWLGMAALRSLAITPRELTKLLSTPAGESGAPPLIKSLAWLVKRRGGWKEMVSKNDAEAIETTVSSEFWIALREGRLFAILRKPDRTFTVPIETSYSKVRPAFPGIRDGEDAHRTARATSEPSAGETTREEGADEERPSDPATPAPRRTFRRMPPGGATDHRLDRPAEPDPSSQALESERRDLILDAIRKIEAVASGRADLEIVRYVREVLDGRDLNLAEYSREVNIPHQTLFDAEKRIQKLLGQALQALDPNKKSEI